MITKMDCVNYMIATGRATEKDVKDLMLYSRWYLRTMHKNLYLSSDFLYVFHKNIFVKDT